MTMSPLQESLVFMAVGMGLVFATLVVVGLSIHVMTTVAERMAKPAPVPEPAPALPVTHPIPQEIGAETIAIIAAAVSATLGVKQRIVAVRRQSDGGTWTTSSRAILHRSHNLPHKGSGQQRPK